MRRPWPASCIFTYGVWIYPICIPPDRAIIYGAVHLVLKTWFIGDLLLFCYWPFPFFFPFLLPFSLLYTEQTVWYWLDLLFFFSLTLILSLLFSHNFFFLALLSLFHLFLVLFPFTCKSKTMKKILSWNAADNVSWMPFGLTSIPTYPFYFHLLIPISLLFSSMEARPLSPFTQSVWF